jgi:Asp/Glu/hydantoin racemase
LLLIPLLERMLPAGKRVGVLTGHAGLLHQRHLEPVGADLSRVAVAGMEAEPEFARVVLGGEQQLHPACMRDDTVRAAERLCRDNPDVGAVVLECTNLVTYRSDVQRATGLPVYDALSLVDMTASGFRLRTFAREYL